MKIYFIGLPGSGKTTLGKEISQILDLPFIDLDLEIERVAGQSISQIFSEQGEDFFRELESKQLRSLSDSQPDFIMATGGGSPCFHDGIGFMNQSGITVFLDPPASTIADQLVELKDRPILVLNPGDRLEDKLTNLRNSRIKFYQQATLTISGEKINSQDLIPLLQTHLKK